MRCGFVNKISAKDQAKIDALWEKAEAEEKPHVHVWCNWLPSKTPAEEFRRCIDCGARETRYADHKR